MYGLISIFLFYWYKLGFVFFFYLVENMFIWGVSVFCWCRIKFMFGRLGLLLDWILLFFVVIEFLVNNWFVCFEFRNFLGVM